MILKREYKNGVERKFKVVSARFANEAHDAIVVITEKNGEIIFAQADQPDIWAQLTRKGALDIAAYEKPQTGEDG